MVKTTAGVTSTGGPGGDDEQGDAGARGRGVVDVVGLSRFEEGQQILRLGNVSCGGNAWCAPEDTFDRELGLRLARARAMEGLEAGMSSRLRAAGVYSRRGDTYQFWRYWRQEVSA